MEPDSLIRIAGARTHNLKGIDLDLPKNRFIVITGVSGSGKSSLAFDTLYAEGQRRYVESLSAYARQFLDRMPRPDVDRIDGLTPAVAIDQRAAAPNPRSTIATLTEIHDYLRVLYAALGQPHDPTTGQPLQRLTTGDIVARLANLADGTRLVLLAPVEETERLRDLPALRDHLKRQGFVRIRLDGGILDLDDPAFAAHRSARQAEIVVDRVVVRPGLEARLADSIETARRWSPHRLLALVQTPGQPDPDLLTLPTSFTNPLTGFTLPEPTPRHFSFNSPQGACPTCHGLGVVQGPDPGRLVPDPSLSLAEGAVKCWWPAHQQRATTLWKRELDALAAHFRVPTDVPFKQLPEEFRHALWHGTGSVPIATGWKTGPSTRSVEKPFVGLLDQLDHLLATARSESLRRCLARFIAHRPCPDCHGHRLQPWVLAVTLGNGQEALAIDRFCARTVSAALAWIRHLQPAGARGTLAAPVVDEVRKRLGFLEDVGLGYLTLDREASTLSGGEFHRIRLATQVGGGLAGVLYVLDEPSVGLHPQDNERLLVAMHRLRDLGNTVLVVEHDLATMRAADWLVEIGPGAGHEGGHLLFSGPTGGFLAATGPSPTRPFLTNDQSIRARSPRRGPGSEPGLWPNQDGTGWLVLRGARGHNLRSVDLRIPLGALVAVAGVSGSGKSSLVDDTLRPALARVLHAATGSPLPFDRLEGIGQIDKLIAIDQSPLARSGRSNPATYCGAFDRIRALFAATPLARARGYPATRFSFNRPGGRCEACLGEGTVSIDMQFLADLQAPCEACGGRRFNRETLEVAFKGHTIADVLEMTVDEAMDFFGRVSEVARRLESLRRAGLGYLRLGQPADTLSGGEAQRLKLAAELARKPGSHTLYLLDEPTTGLHPADVQLLLDNLVALRDQGHTVLVVEHHPDLLRCCDWIIELGPGGGPAGGRIVAEGPPPRLAAGNSPTAPYLAGG